MLEYIPGEPRLLRPANFPEGTPGWGVYVGAARNGVRYAVINLQGRVFMSSIDDPFRAADPRGDDPGVAVGARAKRGETAG